MTWAALAAASLAIAACAATPRPQSRSAPAPTLPARSSPLAAEASAFAGYLRRARAIDPSFSGPGEVAQALQAGASYEPGQFEAGMTAYAAMAALQEPRFVEAVRANRDPGLADRLSADPASVLQLPGGEAAAARAGGALAAEGEALRDQGLKVKRAAYSVQHQAWSKTLVADPRGRLARVKQLSSSPLDMGDLDTAELHASLADGARRGPVGPAAVRGAALAALDVLRQAGRGRALMSDPAASSCLRLAKLNLFQCLASAGPQYEDIFCLGQHAMADTGQCVLDAARPHAARISYRR